MDLTKFGTLPPTASTEGNDSSPRLQWYCEPSSWALPSDETMREGRDGSWSIEDGTTLILKPPAKKDFWRKTYYTPLLVKDDGSFLYATLAREQVFTVTTVFQLTAAAQFDQAGVMIRLGSEHWLKTGIEVVDQKARLSCVVTNIYSDWSTMSWTQQVRDDGKILVSCAIRVHCRGSSYVVEARNPEESNSKWQFLRIAHLNDTIIDKNDPYASHPTVAKAFQGPIPETGTFWAGLFACCPEDQRGGSCSFKSFEIKEGSTFEHNADTNNE